MMRIVYVLGRIRTQILALILLLIMPSGRCTAALSCSVSEMHRPY